jgi:hypothetical protein
LQILSFEPILMWSNLSAEQVRDLYLLTYQLQEIGDVDRNYVKGLRLLSIGFLLGKK